MISRKSLIWALAGIAYLHHNEIIHRDIKPDSESDKQTRHLKWSTDHQERELDALFADEAKTHVKLVDFGVSKFAAGPSPTTAHKVSVAGSPAYMAPELLPGGRGDQAKEAEVSADDQQAGYACDVWSLGENLLRLGLTPIFDMCSRITTLCDRCDALHAGDWSIAVPERRPYRDV